jgi:hypothetical protein
MANKYLIENPKNSVLGVEEEVMGTGNKIKVTLHEVGGKTVGNVWMDNGRKAERLIEERIIEQKPDALLLMGEINRTALARGRDIDADVRVKTAFMGIHLQVESMLGGGKVESE